MNEPNHSGSKGGGVLPSTIAPTGVGKGRKKLWPHVPLALALVLMGALNLLDGYNVPLPELKGDEALNELAQSLSALGGTAQIILGSMMFVAGLGLIWRLVSAWTLAVLLLVIAVGVNVAKANWGLSLVLEGGLLVGIASARSSFNRRTVFASLLLSLSGILAILAYGIFGSYLLGKGFNPPIKDLGTACYFTVVSLSTVGYGDIVPVRPEARWFVMSLLVVGLGVFATAIASVLGPKISGELNRLFNINDKIMEPKEHVILIGDGAIARNAAEEFMLKKVPLVRIVPGPGSETRMETSVVFGDAGEDDVLLRAGIQKAKLVIAALDDDSENALITLGVKHLNPGVQVMAMASSPKSMKRLKLAHADLIVSPAAIGGRMVASLAQGQDLPDMFQDLLEKHPAS